MNTLRGNNGNRIILSSGADTFTNMKGAYDLIAIGQALGLGNSSSSKGNGKCNGTSNAAMNAMKSSPSSLLKQIQHKKNIITMGSTTYDIPEFLMKYKEYFQNDGMWLPSVLRSIV